MYKETDIAYEEGNYWALKVKTGFEIYKAGITHSTRCAFISASFGLVRVKEEIVRRVAKDLLNSYLFPASSNYADNRETLTGTIDSF